MRVGSYPCHETSRTQWDEPYPYADADSRGRRRACAGVYDESGAVGSLYPPSGLCKSADCDRFSTV